MEKILEEKIAARLSITEAEANRIWNVCRDSLIESISENPVFGIRNLGALVTRGPSGRHAAPPADRCHLPGGAL